MSGAINYGDVVEKVFRNNDEGDNTFYREFEDAFEDYKNIFTEADEDEKKVTDAKAKANLWRFRDSDGEFMTLNLVIDQNFSYMYYDEIRKSYNYSTDRDFQQDDTQPTSFFHMPLASKYIIVDTIESKDKIKIQHPFMEDDDETDGSMLFESFYHYTEEALKEKKYCPKNIALLLLFLLHENNESMLQVHSKENERLSLKDIVLNAKKLYNFRRDELFNNFKEVEKKLKEEDLVLSKNGISLFFHILCAYIIEDIQSGKNTYNVSPTVKKEITLDTLFTDSHKLTLCLVHKYHDLCKLQEDYFLTQRPNTYRAIPYALSEWQKYQPIPWLLPLVPQSLKDLKVIETDGEIDCIPCQGGYERFKGRTWSFQHDINGKNNYGMCVRRLDSLIEELDLGPNYKKTPWYVNWVGSMEAAQRRLDKYVEYQQQLSDSGDERYNIITYYVNLIRLRTDLAIKKYFNVSENAPTEKEEDADHTYLGQFTNAFLGLAGDKIISEETKEAITRFADAVSNLIKKIAVGAGLIFYKLVSLMLQSPLMVELLLTLVKTWYEDICMSVSFTATKQALEKNKDGKEILVHKSGPQVFKTEGGVFKQFFFESGRWIATDKEQQKKLAHAKKTKLDNQWSDTAFGLYNALSSYLEEGKWKKMLDNAAFGESTTVKGFETMFGEYFKVFEGLPIVGRAFKKVGPDGIKKIVVGYLQNTGDKTLRKMVKANNQLSQLIRLSSMFMKYALVVTGGAGSFGTCGASAMIEDGKLLGSQMTRSMGKHFNSALFNLPYYAMIVLCEEEYARSKGVESVDREVIISKLCNLTLVGVGEDAYSTKKKSNGQLDEKTKRIALQAKAIYDKYNDQMWNTRAREEKTLVGAIGVLKEKERVKENFIEFLQRNGEKALLDKLVDKDRFIQSSVLTYDLLDSAAGITKEQKSFWKNHWKMLAVAAGCIVVGGAVVALGGPAAVVAGASQMVGSVAGSSAISSVIAAGSKAGELVNKYKDEMQQAMSDSWIMNVSKQMYKGVDCSSYIDEAAKKLGGGQGAKDMVRAYMKKKWEDGTIGKHLEQGVRSYGAMYGRQILQGAHQVGENMSDYIQNFKSYRLEDILNVNKVNRMLFMQKLNEYCQRFSLEEANTIPYHEFELMKVAVMSKGSIDVPFISYEKSKLNAPEIEKFFRQYGVAHSVVS